MNSNVFGSEKLSKIKKTTQEHYGVDCIFKDKSFIEERAKKRKIDNLNKRCSQEWIDHVIEKRITPRNFKIKEIKIDFNTGVWFTLECPECGKDFQWSEEIRIKTGTHAFPYCEKCTSGRNQSIEEKDVLNYVKTFYHGKIITNTKKIIGPKELDIYFPELNKAIEYDGYHWHSYNDILNKIKLCKDKNIKVLNVLDRFWNDKNQKIKMFNIIKNFILDDNNTEWEIENSRVLSNLEIKKEDSAIIENDIIVKNLDDIKELSDNTRVTYHCDVCGKENRLLVQTIKLNSDSICPTCRKKEKMRIWLKSHGGKIPRNGDHF
jgi:hypothetical protein